MTIHRNIASFLICAAAGAMILVTASCGGGSSSSTSTTVSSIVVIPSVSSTTVNGHQAFTANALNDTGNTAGAVTFTWASSDTNVATIDTAGMATGKNGGTTQITASNNGVTSPAVNLTVFPNVGSVSIAPVNVAIKVGEQQHFSATAKDANGNTIANAVFTWSISFSGVASIDSNGTATGISPGTVLVTASIGGVSSPMATLNVTP